jgi:hypothetical protein
VLGFLAVGLTFLWTVDTVASEFFDPVLIPDSDRIIANDTHDGPGNVFCERGTGEMDRQHYDPEIGIAPQANRLVTPWRVECSRGFRRTAAPGTRRIMYLAPPPIPP